MCGDPMQDSEFDERAKNKEWKNEEMKEKEELGKYVSRSMFIYEIMQLGIEEHEKTSELIEKTQEKAFEKLDRFLKNPDKYDKE